jgi:DNA-binding beta-propeller fold protein YncE
VFFFVVSAAVLAADFRPPAGTDIVSRRPGALSVLPGGRQLEPLGIQFATGAGPAGLAISPSGRWIVTPDRGPQRQSVTVLERIGDEVKGVRIVRARRRGEKARSDEFRGVSQGVAFLSDTELYVSEGASGCIRLLNPADGKLKAAFDLNRAGLRPAFSGDLAVDRARGILYALDEANARLVAIDLRRRTVSGDLKLPQTPAALALSPDARRAYVAADVRPGALFVVDIGPALSLARTVPLEDSRAAALLATESSIFVSNADTDSVSIIDARTLDQRDEVELRVPGLEHLRGIQPAGLEIHSGRGWLLVAESGINAVGVVDLASRKVLGHIPAAWKPIGVALHGNTLHTANAKGFGTGPNATAFAPLDAASQAELGRGAVTIARLPAAAELAGLTRRVWELNGFAPPLPAPRPLPPEIRHVVVILKRNRTFDEVFGDIDSDARGRGVRSAPELARFGRRGVLKQAPGELRQRVQSKFLNVTPNHHAIADRWAISDNFYFDGALPGRELWRHLDRHGVAHRKFGDEPDADPNAPDHVRAEEFIRDVQALERLPSFLWISLPSDPTERPRPADGYPFEASYVADNDYALGRVVEYLSSRPEWKSMAVFITEDGSHGGVDHVDSHRTLLLLAGPYIRPGHVSRVNSSFPGILKTAFRLLGVPPMNLFDAAAADLADCFTSTPDFTPFEALPASLELFDPATAKSPSAARR